MTEEQAKKLLSGELWKTAEDGEAAGRLVARGFAGEMRRLCEVFGLDKAAEETGSDAKAEAKETVATGTTAETTVVKVDAKVEADPLMDLVAELEGVA